MSFGRYSPGLNVIRSGKVIEEGSPGLDGSVPQQESGEPTRKRSRDSDWR